MATIGRARAVAQIGPLKLSGFLAWLLWSGVHVAFLINFRSRIRVMAEWLWYYLTFRPGARILYNRRHSKSGAYSAFSARRQPVSREQVASDVTKVSEN
jgi:NADH dehydrogenase